MSEEPIAGTQWHAFNPIAAHTPVRAHARTYYNGIARVPSRAKPLPHTENPAQLRWRYVIARIRLQRLQPKPPIDGGGDE